MREVIKLFTEIQQTSSLNQKKEIISANKENPLFCKCLNFLLDGNVITGISDKKISKKLTLRQITKLKEDSSFEDVIEYLSVNNSGRDTDIFEIQTFLKGHDEHRVFYEQMITKKFRLGADVKLVNKCIPGLIPTFNVMLGTPLEKCKLKDDTWISISQKLNGCRAAWVGNKIMTRQGKEYTGLEHIINDLNYLGYQDFFIDGELLYKNEDGLTDSEAFQKGTGIAMSKDADKNCLKLVVFDMFPLCEFWIGKSEKTYSERVGYFEELIDKLDTYGIENIEYVGRLYEGTDHDAIADWLEFAEINDWEGIMLNLDTPYECKRTKNLIKVKKFHSCDIRCTGIEEGSGRNKGTLGALIADYKGNTVNIGSGFTDEQRKYYWDNPDEVIGRIVTVKYKEETKNKNGGISIQFPVFETARADKNEVSYN